MAQGRERWASRTAFIMAAVGSAIGLGNVWRFPGTAFNNGGGAFFIPYFIALLTAGIPLMIVEYGIGSRFQGAAPKSFRKLGKGFEWIGWWAVLIGMGISIYYCVILAWSWDYLYECGKSLFGDALPWGATEANSYFKDHVAKHGAVAGDGTELGGFNLSAAIGLFVTWAVVWWCIAKGVLRVGKIVMITVPLPLILLVLLAVRGLTLPGAIDGLAYYLAPDWDKLLDPNTWLAAYGQVFFSLSVGWGILIAYASYRPKGSDVVNNAFITSYANCGFSFLAGFAVFSTLGWLAMGLQTPAVITDLETSSFGLAFTSYPTAIANFPGGATIQSLLGVGFFLMLLTLGIDSAFSIIEAVATAAYDKFKITRGKLTFALCALGFVLGLAFCFESGLYWLDVNDRFLAEYSLPLVALVQTIVIGWMIGSKEFRALQDDINDRSEIKVGMWWVWSIKFITPAVLLASFILVLFDLLDVGYGGFPTSVLLLAGAIPALLLIVISIILMRVKGAGDAEDDE